MSRLIAVIGFALLILAGASAINAAFQASGQGNHVENESFTPDPGVNQLANSNIANATYNNSVTVRDANQDVVAASGNYSWLQHNGTLDVTKGSYLDNQSTGNVTYGWVENSDQQRNFAALFGNGMQIAQLLVLVMMLGLLLAAVGTLGGI